MLVAVSENHRCARFGESPGGGKTDPDPGPVYLGVLGAATSSTTADYNTMATDAGSHKEIAAAVLSTLEAALARAPEALVPELPAILGHA